MRANLLRRLRSLLVLALGAPIHVYRTLLSPMLGPSCRFFPSCSEYALTALQRHGPVAGTWLAAARLCRCHPWNGGGVDLVPDAPLARWTRAGRWPASLRSETPADTD